jgi:2-haloacid dehalogenase
VPFDAVITAEQARCYKPHKPIFEEALQRLGAEPGSVMHVAEGVTEIAPMRQLGCTTVWVRRNGRSARLTEAPDL